MNNTLKTILSILGIIALIIGALFLAGLFSVVYSFTLLLTDRKW
jgi:hypothetical protein